MRLKTLHAIRVAIQAVDRVLNANLPMTNIWANSSVVSTHKQTR
jgi:hypothetical protein